MEGSDVDVRDASPRGFSSQTKPIGTRHVPVHGLNQSSSLSTNLEMCNERERMLHNKAIAW